MAIYAELSNGDGKPPTVPLRRLTLSTRRIQCPGTLGERNEGARRAASICFVNSHENTRSDGVVVESVAT